MRLLFLVLAFLSASLTSVGVASRGDGSVSLREKIGQMILVGFHGTKKDDREVTSLLAQAQRGEIGGVIFFAYNLKSPNQIRALTSAFRSVPTPLPLLLAIDQEGGRVQRLSSKNGFRDFLSAKKVAEAFSPSQALGYYKTMAQMVSSAGFNLIFGPVVDLHQSPKKGSKPSPVIGKIERSYGKSPDQVARYGASFVDACHQYGLLTSLKHFPGHGFSKADSHKGMVDITSTADPSERTPFYHLIQSGRADMVMTAHVMNKNWDAAYPATLSDKVLHPLLRKKASYQGVLITDDLHMGAIGQHYSLKEIVIQAVRAGNDILLFSNNQAAAQGVKDFKAKQTLAQEVTDILLRAVKEGIIPEDRIHASYQRISHLKGKISLPRVRSTA